MDSNRNLNVSSYDFFLASPFGNVNSSKASEQIHGPLGVRCVGVNVSPPLPCAGKLLQFMSRGMMICRVFCVWDLLGRSWALWGRSWGTLGASWGALGALLDALGALLGCLGALLGSSWGTLGRILGHLGGILGEISKNSRVLYVFWSHFGTQNGSQNH